MRQICAQSLSAWEGSGRRLLLVAWAATLLSPVSAFAQTPVCRSYFTLQNQNRMVFGSVNTECAPSVHTVPFGNWGVMTPYDEPRDGAQFQGWCWSNINPQCPPIGDPRIEWNSCTSQFPPPDCSYYNHNGCEWQITNNTSANNYADNQKDELVSCPTDTDDDGRCDTGGCLQACQVTIEAADNFMDLLEHDPFPDPTPWDPVVVLNFPSQWASATSCSVSECQGSGFSNWIINSYNGIAEAQMRIWVRYATFIPGPTCQPSCTY